MSLYRIPNASFSAVSPIKCNINCERKKIHVGSGTGFFFEHAEGLYIITNRHVIINESDDYFPDEITLRLHVDQSDLAKNKEYEVELYDEENPNWLEHPFDPKVDVVAIPLDLDEIESKFLYAAYNYETTFSYVSHQVNIPFGADFMVMGYPLEFYDDINNLPIIRNATLASIYPIPFRNNQHFLIDSRLHSGSSGSPVLTKPNTLLIDNEGKLAAQDQYQPLLIGVYSGTVPMRDELLDDHLGLGSVWFDYLIPEIIEQKPSRD
jgi:hypothetical protein